MMSASSSLWHAPFLLLLPDLCPSRLARTSLSEPLFHFRRSSIVRWSRSERRILLLLFPSSFVLLHFVVSISNPGEQDCHSSAKMYNTPLSKKGLKTFIYCLVLYDSIEANFDKKPPQFPFIPREETFSARTLTIEMHFPRLNA